MFTLYDNYGLGFLVIIKVKDLTLIFMDRISPVTQIRVLFLAYGIQSMPRKKVLRPKKNGLIGVT